MGVGLRRESGYLYEVAGNQSAPGFLTLTTDFSGPAAPVLDLPAAVDSGRRQHTNAMCVCNADVCAVAPETLWYGTLASSLTGNTVAWDFSGLGSFDFH